MEKYFKKETPPTREERMEISDVYHGSGCDLANCSKCGCLKGKDRSFWQSSSACQMHLSPKKAILPRIGLPQASPLIV